MWRLLRPIADEAISVCLARDRRPDDPVAFFRAGVEFERLPDGPWIVRSWRIRTPEVVFVRMDMLGWSST